MYTVHLYPACTMIPLQSTIVNASLRQISKQVITRNTKIITSRILDILLLLSHGTRVVGFSIWRHNKIMFVLASINIIFLSCSSSHFCMVIGFRSTSDIFTFETLSSPIRILCSQIISTVTYFGTLRAT